MRRKFWLWLLLSSCQPLPKPPIAPDTTRQVLTDLYTYRAYLQAQNLPLSTSESLLALYTAQRLQAYGIDTGRWESLRTYYSHYPEAWQALLDSVLYSFGSSR